MQQRRAQHVCGQDGIEQLGVFARHDRIVEDEDVIRVDV